MIYLNLLAITLIVILIQIGGFWEHLEKWIGKWFNIRDLHITIFECAFCQNWWVSLIYIICMNQFSILNILYILFLSFLTPTLSELLFKIKNLLEKLIEKL